MYELMRELRHAFLTPDSRALIVRRNLTLDLYASRLKLQIQSVNWRRVRDEELGFPCARRPPCRGNAEITRRDLITRSFSLFLSLFFFPSLSSYFLQDRRTLNNPRSTNAIRCLAEEEKRARARARLSIIMGRNVARVCVSFSRFHRAARRRHPRVDYSRDVIFSRAVQSSSRPAPRRAPARVTSRRRIERNKRQP